MARHANTTSDYGAPTTTRSGGFHRPLLLANHALHWISSMIVLGISAYFLNNYTHNTHLRYWVSIAAIDAILYLPAMALPFLKSYKGYLAPLAWIFSYLWLTAFIFASQDYDFNGGPFANSPTAVDKPALKKTLEAFAFIAFFTSLVGFALESRLWDTQRVRGTGAAFDDKHHAHAGTTTAVPAGTTATV